MYFLRIDVFPIDKVIIAKQKETLIDLLFSKYNFIENVPDLKEGTEILNDLFEGYSDTIEKFQFGKLTIEKAISFEGCDIERV
jgi:hypothetical protein